MQPGMLLNAASWHITLDWSEDEQRTLEEHLQRFPPDWYDALQRYIKLAAILPRKTVRDVALRCKWTIQQQLIRKRKLAEGAMGLAAKKPSIPGLGPGKSPLMPMPLVRLTTRAAHSKQQLTYTMASTASQLQLC